MLAGRQGDSMGSYQRGTTVTIEIWFKNTRTGSFVDPDTGTKLLTIYKDGSAVKSVADASILKLDTGKFYYDWETATDLEKGIYVYEWKATIGGNDVTESALLRIRERKVG